jgi:hypothetical protein
VVVVVLYLSPKRRKKSDHDFSFFIFSQFSLTFIYYNKVYASVANIVYDGNVLKISQSATQYKLIFAFILRFIDGLLGLYVNFALMLDTSGALNIMLNFAALHFLQGTLYKQAKLNRTQIGKRKIISKRRKKKQKRG